MVGSKAARVGVVLLAAFPLLLGGCLFIADGDALSEGCPAGEKPCDGACVSELDPDFGCGSSACTPCALPKATAVCAEDSGECRVAACILAYEDCDGVQDNGCEVHLDTDVEHCGRCDVACEASPRASPACGGGACYVRECEVGYGDCNLVFDDGCEVNLATSETHCGACDSGCDGGKTCSSGECRR